MSEQRSLVWHNQRLGRFTASEVHALMNVKGLGDTGLSLARKKAQEIVFGRDENWNVTTYDMQRGIEQERIAFEIFKERKELDFIEVKEAVFFPFGENTGSSPDGLVGNDAVLEIKAPRPDKFFKLVELGIDAIDKEYIYQMQLQMKCTNSKRAHFFNYLEWNDEQFTHELIVERDDEIIDRILERIEQAVIERDKIVKKLIENCQFKELLKPFEK